MPLCCCDVYISSFQEAKSQESTLGYPNSQASDTSQLISQASFDGIYDLSQLHISVYEATWAKCLCLVPARKISKVAEPLVDKMRSRMWSNAKMYKSDPIQLTIYSVEHSNKTLDAKFQLSCHPGTLDSQPWLCTAEFR